MILTFEHTQDKKQPVEFGNKVKISSIPRPKVIASTGWGGSVNSDFIPEDKVLESDGIWTCRRGYYTAIVRPNRFISDPWYPGGGYWIYKSDTWIKVEVGYDYYVAPPVKPEKPANTVENSQQGYNETPSPDNEIEALAGEEWTNTWRQIEAGFNYKCVDFYDRDYLGMGEKRAKKNIINGLIPDLAAAKRVGSLYVFATGKKRTKYTFDIPPNLKIKSGRVVRGIYSPRALNNNILITNRKIMADAEKQNYMISGTYVDRNK